MAKAFVVGHPSGSGMQISLHDSQLLDIDDEQRLLHYRTPTEPGSSGNPVFQRAVGGDGGAPRRLGQDAATARTGAVPVQRRHLAKPALRAAANG
ncbi:MAG: serine protease [Chromatiales bacterium]|nr:serine protease [Chromatiales bacterium]